MPRSHKPRKRFDPRRHPIDVNPPELAFGQAALLHPSQRVDIVRKAAGAFEAFRTGAGSAYAWGDLADALNIAEALAKRNLANDHAHKFSAGQEALAAVIARKAGGGSYTLKPAELTALRDALDIYEIQLEVCSTREYLEAFDEVQRRTAAAIRGSAGPDTHIVIADYGIAAMSQRRAA